MVYLMANVLKLPASNIQSKKIKWSNQANTTYYDYYLWNATLGQKTPSYFNSQNPSQGWALSNLPTHIVMDKIIFRKQKSPGLGKTSF